MAKRQTRGRRNRPPEDNDAAPAAEQPLRLEYRSPAELAENPRNWRRHPEAQTAAMADVLAEVGFAGCCLYNETTGRLVDGHLRREVAIAKGIDLVPVLIGRWTEAQEAKILATLDPIAGQAEADGAKLAELLREVETGSESLQQMLAELAEEAGVIPEDGDLPDRATAATHTCTLVYTDDDLPALRACLDLAELPANKLGAKIIERIRTEAETRTHK